MRWRLPSLALSGLLCSMPIPAAVYHVTPSGSDDGGGSASRPWRTLGKAIRSIKEGDTVLVHEGIYQEVLSPRVSGTESDWIEVAAAPGETPVIDGTSLGFGGSRPGLVSFSGNVSHFRLRGFEIRNGNDEQSASSDPVGIAFQDEVDHIEIIDCRIHSISSRHEDLTPMGVSIGGSASNLTIMGGSVSNIRTSARFGNAHAIAVYGNERMPVDRVTVQNVDIFDLTLGESESLVFNGNVTHFEAIGNRIHHSNNIGIDVIGFEGVGPPGQDQARSGRIAANVIHAVSTRENRAYNEFSAGGIYVDGGRDVLIERNLIHHCDLGIELASEGRDGLTSGITVRDNVVWHNAIGGILLGGYDTGRGATEDCVIANNTFFENDTERFEIGEVNIRYRTNGNLFTNNIFKAGGQGLFVTFPREFAASTGNLFDGNCYFTDARSIGWEWRGNRASSWAAFRRLSRQESSGFYGDPEFAGDTSEPRGLGLAATSFLIDKGIGAAADAEARRDAAGWPRVSGSAIDVGAYEYSGEFRAPAWEALSITLQREGMLVRFPAAAPFEDRPLRVEYSLDGRRWTTIADRRAGADSWVAAHGVRIRPSPESVDLVDERALNGGLFRGIASP